MHGLPRSKPGTGDSLLRFLLSSSVMGIHAFAEALCVGAHSPDWALQGLQCDLGCDSGSKVPDQNSQRLGQMFTASESVCNAASSHVGTTLDSSSNNSSPVYKTVLLLPATTALFV